MSKDSIEAITRGVFGVPTLMVGGWLFWGDAADMVRDYLVDPTAFLADESRIAALPSGATRTAKT